MPKVKKECQHVHFILIFVLIITVLFYRRKQTVYMYFSNVGNRQIVNDWII